MARLFDQSALARTDAWREQSGDRDRSIATAIGGCAKVYSPEVDRRDRGGARPAATDTPYEVVGGQLCRMVGTRDGEFYPVPLCNFTASIAGEIIRDDGVEQFRRLSLEGSLATGEELPAIGVTVEEFARGDWPLTRWGSRAIVFAGQGNKDHLRAAIQLRSEHPTIRTVYVHLGWRQVDGQWCYLHAGGAVGPPGPLSTEVEVPTALALFRLPIPPAGIERTTAVLAMLGLLSGLAPDHIIMTALALAVRAVLPDCDFSMHLVGPTGAFKTELAALLQRCFGPEMDDRHLPGNWSSTANALEGLTFAAKDALLVVDDFKPHGSQQDVSRMHKEADRLFRAIGNHCGRQRMRADSSLRPEKPPRCTVLSTGEDAPRGASLRARVAIIEVARGEMDQPRLTQCQRDAASGLYAAAMSAYLAWLAPQFDDVVQRFQARSISLRDRLAGTASHRRVPAMIGSLLAAFELFLKFCVEAGAITEEESAALRQRCLAALLESADQQNAYHTEADPVDRYLALVAAVLTSGRAHVAALDGKAPAEPHDPTAWGWRRADDGGWREQGHHVGWIHGNHLLLDPQSSFAEVNRLAGEQGEAFSVSPNTLYKQLRDRGLLASTEGKHHTPRRRIGRLRRRVLHLRVSTLLEIGPRGPKDEKPPEMGPLLGPRPGTPFAGTTETRSQNEVPDPAQNQGLGPLGPLGPRSPGERTGRRETAVDWCVIDPDPY
jgi:hypothetical protein